MTVEIPVQLEAALKAQAVARGVSAEGYVREVLERELSEPEQGRVRRPLKTSYGVLAEFGPGPSAEEIDANRAEMFRNFGSGA